MSYDGDMAKVIRRATEQGWRHRVTEKNHHQFLSPDGETIVHASGTPSDDGGWRKFLEDMKRGGYEPNGATTALGDLLSAARTVVAPPIVSTISARAVICDHLKAHPKGAPVADMEAIFMKLRPEMERSNVSSAMSALLSKGTVLRIAKGVYRLKTDVDREAEQNGARELVAKIPHSQPPAPSFLATSVEKTGDEAIDATLSELDAAVSQVLDGVAKLDSLLRKNRETMKKIAAFKKMMEAF